jgi:methionyl aminopeptidase
VNRPETAVARPGPNEPCWCGSGLKYKKCHRQADGASGAPLPTVRRVRPGRLSAPRTVPAGIPRPDYVPSGRPGSGVPGDPRTRIARMRRACTAAADVLREVGAAVHPGVTTDALDALAHQGYLARGGYPSTLGYRGFKKSMCTSVNEVVVHGIPDDRPLESGDIVNCDVTIYLEGMHGDCSATFGVGEIDAGAKKLLRVTEEALFKGIEAVRPGRQIRDIGRAIAAHAEANGFGVVRNYCGHGIGEIFHTDLQIPHFDDASATTPIEEGMIFTIEPMLTEGSWGVKHWDDGWTAVTADGKRSAQMEHTVLVGRDGAEILTLPSAS